MRSRLAGICLYPARHVRWRIIAPYALLTLALAAGGAYLVTRVVVSSFEERFDNQLAEASRVAADAVVRQESRHLETVRAVAFTDGLPAAVRRGDAAAVERLTAPLAANAHAHLVEVLDRGGRRIYGTRLVDDPSLTYAPLSDASDRSSWQIVQQVLAGRTDPVGNKYAAIEPTAQGAALYTAGPILDNGGLVGVVLVGTPLVQLVGDLKGQALADVSIYDPQGAPLASTLAPETGDLRADLLPAPRVVAAAGNEPVREGKTLSQRNFDLLYSSLSVRGRPVGLYSVALPSSYVLSAGVATRADLVLLFAGAAVAVLAVGWLVSRTITRPVFRLVAAARAVGAGDLSARSGVRGDDEIGAFGRAFDAMTDRVQRQHLATVGALASAIDARDPYTMGHSMRVGQLAVELGRELGVTPAQRQDLEVGGYLHDIGKIGVRDTVLLKDGKLTPEEREQIERHPRIGLQILAPVELPPDVIAFVGGHHEKLDGSGYPAGLSGDAIGLVARIATVADVYDALTSDRPYRRGMTAEEALAILRREVSGGTVDAGAVSALERALPRWEERLRTDAKLAGIRFDGPPRPLAA
ncbi:MAG: HD domain-containing protein [Dehalococcoidia bacterium]|nr:HD domain-containing protein [Dehalococcoidia bacterium]